MSASNSIITPPDIVLSPMRVTYNGVDLGGTEGGVTFSPKYDIADIMVDQYGKTKIDGVVSGEHFNVKFTLAETKNKSNWKVAFPHSKLVGSGGEGSESIYFDMQIGDKLSNHTAVLILHPLSAVDGDLSQDIMIYKAVALSASELKYGPDKQVGLAVEMEALPDTNVIPARFCLYGDPSIGIINASAGAAVPGMSNVGNGTIGAIGVNNAKTETETVTVQCVGQTSGNDFSVTGSLSGPLGDLHLNAASGSLIHFVAPPISFTITQLGTQFAYGDVFTIPTTGANYS